jgi:GxxExxY protein
MIAKTEPLQNKLEELENSIIDAALTVRKYWGAGLLDEIYRLSLIQELTNRGIKVRTQVPMPVKFDELTFEDAYRIDILVEDCVIIEVKPCCSKADLYKSHVSTYLKHSGYRLGFLLDYDARQAKKCVNKITP